MTELSRETRALLERSRGGPTLTAAHRARLKAAILAKAAGVSVVATATSAAAWTTLGMKVAGAVGLVVAAGAGITMAAGTWEGPTTKPAVAPPPGQAAANRKNAVEGSGPPPAQSGMLAVPEPLTTSPPEEPAVRPEPPPNVVQSPSRIMKAAIEPASTTRPAVAVEPAPSEVPSSAGIVRGLPSVDPSAGLPPPAIDLGSTLEEQTMLLREIDRAMKAGDPDRALILLDAHVNRFPRSPLEPERAAERVFALCLSGRTAEAKVAASAFLRAHPSGPLAARVQASCGGGVDRR